MKKLLQLFIVLAVISLVACQQAVKKEGGEEAIKKTETTTAPQEDATGNAAVDAVGNDISNVNNVEKDLSSDELNDVDAGLADIQNI